MESLFTIDALGSLITLSVMEIVLGVDNIVFLSILVAKLPAAQQEQTRKLGLFLALFMRIGLLFTISWLMGLEADLFAVFGIGFSGRDLILLTGGLFLLGKATHEIYDKLEGEHQEGKAPSASSMAIILVQVVLLDLVFSLDSVITAVGMAQQLSIMVAATVIAVMVMLVFAKSIGDFVNRHPSVKLLALSFLILIGVILMAEGMGQHISKGYVYFAMAFSLFVEILNMRFRRKQKPVELHGRYDAPKSEAPAA
jgi:predicted tellurium resistance membrane protein TerC